MSLMPTELRVPTWTVGERLRKAREDAGITQAELSELISVSRRQIIDYESGKKTPTRGQYLLWQMMTRVPAEWLEHGTLPAGPPNGFPGESPQITERLLAAA